MTLYVNAEVFDHCVLHSSVKWTTQTVSSLVEELKVACPNRTVTHSKWLDVTAGKLSISEASAYWSVLIASKAFILAQLGDWIDLQTLSILLLCQCFPHVRARADSFHRSEALAQTLATTAINTHSAVHSPINRSGSNRNSLVNLGKLLRDNSATLSFVVEHLALFVNFVTLNLTPDDDFDVLPDQVDKLGLLITVPENSKTLSAYALHGEETVKASALVALLSKSLMWNDELFPSFDLVTVSQQSLLTSNGSDRNSLYVINHHRTTLLRSEQTDPIVKNMFIVNCSETSIYVADGIRNVYIAGCVDCEIVLMAVTGSCVVSHSDKVVLRTVAASLRLENSTDCQVFVYTGRGVVLIGDTRGITLAPFNVSSSTHEVMLASKTGIYPDSSHATLWAQPICATLTDSPYLLLPPDKLRVVAFPELSNRGPQALAVCLPQVYADALKEKQANLVNLKHEVLSIADESISSKLNAVIAGHFRDWVSSHNKARTIIEISKQAHPDQ